MFACHWQPVRNPSSIVAELEAGFRQRLPPALRRPYDQLRPPHRMVSEAERSLITGRLLAPAGKLSGKQTRRLAQHWQAGMSQVHRFPGFPGPFESAVRDAEASLGKASTREVRDLAAQALWEGATGRRRLEGWWAWERWADKGREVARALEKTAEWLLKAGFVVLVLQIALDAVTGTKSSFDLAVEAVGPLGWRLAAGLLFGGAALGGLAVELESWLPLSPALATRALAAACAGEILPRRPITLSLATSRYQLYGPWKATLANEPVATVSRIGSRAVGAFGWFGLVIGSLGLASVIVGADNLGRGPIYVIYSAIGGFALLSGIFWIIGGVHELLAPRASVILRIWALMSIVLAVAILLFGLVFTISGWAHRIAGTA
jgi:hypothetical protein